MTRLSFSFVKLRSKSQLVEWLAGTQIVLLAIALVCFGGWIKIKLGVLIREQIIAENQLIAEQMGRVLASVQSAPVEFGDENWGRLQTFVEDAKLPNDGYLCVASSETGKLLCHPKMRTIPVLRDLSVGQMQLEMQDSGKSTLLAAIGNLDKTQIEVVTGIVGAGTRTEIVSAAVLPQINGVLLLHQAEASTQQAVSRILTPLGYVGLVIGLSMIVITTKVGVAIIKRYENELAIINEGLEQTIRDRTRALTKTRDAVIFGLAKLAESRDSDTGEHLERISLFSTELAATVERRAGNSHSPLVDSIGLASSLHDIGKVGVPDRVLLKPGRLNAEERKIIQAHPQVGEECLNAIEERLGNDGFLSLAKEICAYHHEKWDGSGYPYQLVGSQIPISARIVAVADEYDALRSRRPYKDPMTHEAAREIIVKGSGKHFDPDIVKSFLECESDFERISSNYVAANQISPSVQTTPFFDSLAFSAPSAIQTSL